jgi:hypothetical protein
MAHEDKIPKMSEEALRKFVDDFVSDRIFTDKHILARNKNAHPHSLIYVFPVLGLGALDDFTDEEKKSIGCVWEYMSSAGPRAINGMPCFGSARLMHIDDWNSIVGAIEAEEDRRKNIEIKPRDKD